jgi:DNA-binding IclR family transcriptional regulator
VPDSIRTLDRGFAILELFSEREPEWTTTAIARATGLPVPTAHRLLGVLESRGYVARDADSKRFRLGAAAARLGSVARTAPDVRAAGAGLLQRVSRGADVTAMLWVLNGTRDRAVCVGRVEGARTLRLSAFPGLEQPLHAGASRKTLLAHLDEGEIDRVAGGELPRLSRGTITDRAALRAELGRIREQGWAGSFEETDAGAWGVAVPIIGPGTGIVAALGMAAPTARYSRGEAVSQVRRLKVAARELTQTLGIV